MRPLLLALLLLATPALAQDPTTDLAAYRRLFSAQTLTETVGPGASAGAITGWTMQYRGVVPGAAFALAQLPGGRTPWQFTNGQADAATAGQMALERCNRNADGACRLLATDGVVPGQPPFRPDLTTTIGALRASPLHFRHGPARAQGVLVFGHGVSGQREDLRNTPAQGWVSAFNDAGFDIFRFDRHPNADDLPRSQALLVAAVPLLRAAGYRQVVLAGQSRGAWQSLGAAAQVPVEAVIAIAPARHGAWNASNSQSAALDDWRGLVAGLPAERTRVAVALILGDDFDADPAARLSRVADAARRRTAPTLGVQPAADNIRGHGGGASTAFTQAWSACLLAFATAAAPPTGVVTQPCVR